MLSPERYPSTQDFSCSCWAVFFGVLIHVPQEKLVGWMTVLGSCACAVDIATASASMAMRSTFPSHYITACPVQSIERPKVVYAPAAPKPLVALGLFVGTHQFSPACAELVPFPRSPLARPRRPT